jgi:hypothetical protein
MPDVRRLPTATCESASCPSSPAPSPFRARRARLLGVSCAHRMSSSSARRARPLPAAARSAFSRLPTGLFSCPTHARARIPKPSLAPRLVLPRSRWSQRLEWAQTPSGFSPWFAPTLFALTPSSVVPSRATGSMQWRSPALPQPPDPSIRLTNRPPARNRRLTPACSGLASLATDTRR